MVTVAILPLEAILVILHSLGFDVHTGPHIPPTHPGARLQATSSSRRLARSTSTSELDAFAVSCASPSCLWLARGASHHQSVLLFFLLLYGPLPFLQ